VSKKALILVFLVLLAGFSNFTFAEVPNIKNILKQIDDNNELKYDGTAKVLATVQKADEGIKVYEYIYYRRDAGKLFLIIMTSPEIEKGNGYLKQGDNYWMYRKNTRTFQHITEGESIAGSDSKVEDVEEILTNKYKPAINESKNEKIIETKLGNIPVYQFEIEAKNEDEYYPKRVYWVRKDNYLPLKAQCYSLSGTLMRTAYYLKYTQIKGQYLMINGIFVNEIEKGNKTIVEVKDISTQKIDDCVFTKAYLENLSK
jgi:outer membrane lipoprotein-sorting protein